VFKAIARESSGGILAENTAFDGANCPAVLIENLDGHDLRYLLAVLNSRLLSKHLRQVCPPKLSGYVKFSATCLSDAPIRVLDLSNASDRTAHDRMVSLVEQMLAMHRQLASARTPHEQTALERQIAATDTQIDRLDYPLYGLNEEEIQIVEGNL
jgi:hypothetical protein